MTTTEKKSIECSKVLQLMDNDYTYSQALEIVLTSSQVNKALLEKELNLYV